MDTPTRASNMNSTRGIIPFIENKALYEVEKPYTVVPLAGSGVEPASNITLCRQEVTILDIRKRGFIVAENGVEVVQHCSDNLVLEDLAAVTAYKTETEALLYKVFPDAEYVLTWDFRHRKNSDEAAASIINLNDPLRLDKPATAAHIDATFISGPRIAERYISQEIRDQYLKPGYRFRLINTWRTLTPQLEDCPLSVCDFRSTDPEDLLASDLVYPHRHGEIYHIRYNKDQKWYWLPKHDPTEVYVILTYDSTMGSGAKYCAHTSFQNLDAPHDTPVRESVETRSIVISRE